MATQSTSIVLAVDTMYIHSVDSVFKFGEMMVSLIVFICACVWGPANGGAWVQFVSMSAIIVLGLLFVLKLMRIVNKLPKVVSVPFVEFCIYALWLLMYLISGIVAAVRGFNPAAAAAAFFSFASALVVGADTAFKFRAWRDGDVSRPAGQPEVPVPPTATDQARSTGQY